MGVVGGGGGGGDLLFWHDIAMPRYTYSINYC